MKKLLILCLTVVPLGLFAQSETTDALQKRIGEPFTLFFYKNTLRMLNQSDNKEFDEMIKNIEKMKFLMFDKQVANFGKAEYNKLVGSYKSEQYEPAITSRYQGKSFDVYLKDRKGSPLGTIVLVNDSTNLYVLDMLGTIDIRHAQEFFSTIEKSSEIGDKIKGFMHKGK